MNVAIVQNLQINDDLKSKLQLFLTQFDAYRLGNTEINLDPNSFTIVAEEALESTIIENPVNSIETTEPKKRRFRFLERLFLTEYNDDGEEL